MASHPEGHQAKAQERQRAWFWNLGFCAPTEPIFTAWSKPPLFAKAAQPRIVSHRVVYESYFMGGWAPDQLITADSRAD